MSVVGGCCALSDVGVDMILWFAAYKFRRIVLIRLKRYILVVYGVVCENLTD